MRDPVRSVLEMTSRSPLKLLRRVVFNADVFDGADEVADDDEVP